MEMIGSVPPTHQPLSVEWVGLILITSITLWAMGEGDDDITPCSGNAIIISVKMYWYLIYLLHLFQHLLPPPGDVITDQIDSARSQNLTEDT